jgi:hypothetical protein
MHSVDNTPMTPTNPPSETLSQDEAEEVLETVLHDGPAAIKAMIQEIWDRDRIDLEQCYRRESAIEEQLRRDEHLPPLNLPPWDDVKPLRTP